MDGWGRDSAEERVTQHVVSLPRTVIKQIFTKMKRRNNETINSSFSLSLMLLLPGLDWQNRQWHAAHISSTKHTHASIYILCVNKNRICHKQWKRIKMPFEKENWSKLLLVGCRIYRMVNTQFASRYNVVWHKPTRTQVCVWQKESLTVNKLLEYDSRKSNDVAAENWQTHQNWCLALSPIENHAQQIYIRQTNERAWACLRKWTKIN